MKLKIDKNTILLLAISIKMYIDGITGADYVNLNGPTAKVGWGNRMSGNKYNWYDTCDTTIETMDISTYNTKIAFGGRTKSLRMFEDVEGTCLTADCGCATLYGGWRAFVAVVELRSGGLYHKWNVG